MDAATKNKFLKSLAIGCLIVAIILAVVLSLSAAAEVVQPTEDFYYLDEADVLSVDTEGEIFFANERLYEACGAEIVVVAIDSTGGMSIEDYAYTLFNGWEIGGESYRGLLLLMAIEDDNYYVMPGTALSMYFDSATIGKMMDEYLEPDFAKKNYDAGAKSFFEASFEKVVDDFNLNLSIDDAVQDYNAFMSEYESVGSDHAVQSAPMDREVRVEMQPVFGIGPIVLIIILLIILSRVTSRFRRVPRTYHNPPPPGVHIHVRRPSSAANFAAGMMLGKMMRPRHNVHRGPGVGSRPMEGFNSGRSFGGNRMNSSGGFGGASRGGAGSFGGASRSSSGRSFGGFGGASRSGGASRGQSTRGGGAGRFRR